MVEYFQTLFAQMTTQAKEAAIHLIWNSMSGYDQRMVDMPVYGDTRMPVSTMRRQFQAAFLANRDLGFSCSDS